MGRREGLTRGESHTDNLDRRALVCQRRHFVDDKQDGVTRLTHPPVTRHYHQLIAVNHLVRVPLPQRLLDTRHGQARNLGDPR